MTDEESAWYAYDGAHQHYPHADLLADARCSRAVLDFLATTDVGGLVPGDEAAESEASE